VKEAKTFRPNIVALEPGKKKHPGSKRKNGVNKEKRAVKYPGKGGPPKNTGSHKLMGPPLPTR